MRLEINGFLVMAEEDNFNILCTAMRQVMFNNSLQSFYISPRRLFKGYVNFVGPGLNNVE
jgi:hypothetical protein